MINDKTSYKGVEILNEIFRKDRKILGKWRRLS